ncbi:unnamed protein product [Protopolystoma xenopodis]|uniref:C2H2-type domain-containing protein n=1 Tax=Protopolystoma xenopodis TaxID=117903 RepID=A0A3S5C0N4_9PLAT|nr:unnamed protein product [Protopolystoma xenopodis]
MPLYSCTFCPVFCLTLNDLALHLSSAHEGRTEIPLSLDNSEHSSSSPTKVSHIHVTIMKQSAGIQPSFSLKKSNPNMSPISTEYRSLFDDLASVVNAPAANRCSPPQSPVRDFRNCVLASDDVDDDIVCPECDFSSKDRDEVMQHITDTH